MFSFKQWFILITEGANEDLALSILQNDQNALNQLRTIAPEPKYLPAIAFFYLQHKNLNNLQQYFNKLQELVNKRKINYQPQGTKGVSLNGQFINNWLGFTEIIDGLASLQPKKVNKPIPTDTENLHQQEDANRIFNNDKVIVYESHSPQACIKYGQGHSLCISRPGNTMWQSYRDTQTSTFYFIFDKTKDESDPLRIVVVDITESGILLTDANNKTGTIAEYGEDANAYLNYLKSLGVPTEIFKNIAKSPEEKEEHRHLGEPNKDLNWFKNLPSELNYKSKYIGRGHKLTNEQFDFLWDHNAEDLLNQYINIGQKLNDYQMDRVFTKNSLKKSYLRQRLIVDEQMHDLSRKEFDQLSPEQQQSVKENILAMEPNDAMEHAAAGGYKDVVELLMSKGATDFDTAMKYAAAGGYKDIVELLMSKGATDFDGAMIAAAAYGNKDMVELMISKGARKLSFNFAMEYAAMGGHKDMVELMISKGANSFDNAMAYAVRNKHKDIVKLLKNAMDKYQ